MPSAVKNMLKRRDGHDFSNIEFGRVIEIEDEGEPGKFHKASASFGGVSGNAKAVILLNPMKVLTIEQFSFPFTSPAKIRNALRLQLSQLPAEKAGEGGSEDDSGELEFFPAVIETKGKMTSGAAWCTTRRELNVQSSGKLSRTWPAPLPFISGLQASGGNGTTIYIDEENICSMLWQENRPVLYRWRRRVSSGSLEKELRWYEGYCAARNLSRGGSYIFDAEENGGSSGELRSIVAESVRLCPWINGVNISSAALSSARSLEQITRQAALVTIPLLFLGVVMLLAEGLKLYQVQEQAEALRTRSEEYYRTVFEPSRAGRISNPVTLARGKIAELTGTAGPAHPLASVLADLGEIFAADPSMDVTLDIVRYNSEGIDCTGTAKDMTTVLNFRKAWEDKNNMAQVDNTQFVSGIGYRFDLRVRWQQ